MIADRLLDADGFIFVIVGNAMTLEGATGEQEWNKQQGNQAHNRYLVGILHVLRAQHGLAV